MHQIVELNLPHAMEGKLYLEEGGRRVLHVFAGLSADDLEAIERLKKSLAKRVGGLHGYDECVVHLKNDSPGPKPRPRRPSDKRGT